MYAGIPTTEIEKYDCSNRVAALLSSQTLPAFTESDIIQDDISFDEYLIKVKSRAMHYDDLCEDTMNMMHEFYKQCQPPSVAAHYIVFDSIEAKEYDKH